MGKIKRNIFIFVCNYTEPTRYTLLAVGIFLLFLLFVISPSDSIIYYLVVISLLILGSTLMVVAAALDSIISRNQFSNEVERYNDTNPFHEIDEYNEYVSASFADKVMFINHFYDSVCFVNPEKVVDHSKPNLEKHKYAKNNIENSQGKMNALKGKPATSSDVKKEQCTAKTANNEPRTRIKQINNKLMQDMGLRRQFLVHKKAKTQILDEFAKQLIIVAFIKFLYDNTSVHFADDKNNALLISFVLAVITYGVYFFYIRGKKRPDEKYHLLEYEIKKIDSLITNVDTPDDWDLKKKQQAMNSPRRIKPHKK